MPSGVVFVAILVIWAVILAPRAMKLYERTSTQRTTKRFSSAMTVLGSGKSMARVAVDTARRGSTVAVDTRAPIVALERQHSNEPFTHARTGGAVQRRRRVVAVGAALVALAAILALMGALPWVAVPLASLPLAMFLVACAVSVRQQRQGLASTAGERPTPAQQPSALTGRYAEKSPSTADEPMQDVVVLSTRRARRSGLRAGSWTQARILEADLAIAATYASAEEQLGLDRFVASPSDVDGQPYLRAANE